MVWEDLWSELDDQDKESGGSLSSVLCLLDGDGLDLGERSPQGQRTILNGGAGVA